MVLRHKIKNGQKTRVTLVFCFYHFYCKICPYEWFLFDIQHNTIVWGHDLSYYLPIKANIGGWNFRPFPKLYWGFKMVVSSFICCEKHCVRWCDTLQLWYHIAKCELRMFFGDNCSALFQTWLHKLFRLEILQETRHMHWNLHFVRIHDNLVILFWKIFPVPSLAAEILCTLYLKYILGTIISPRNLVTKFTDENTFYIIFYFSSWVLPHMW